MQLQMCNLNAMSQCNYDLLAVDLIDLDSRSRCNLDLDRKYIDNELDLEISRGRERDLIKKI